MTSPAFAEVAHAAKMVEEEMRRVGYWSAGLPPEPKANELFGGATFENWLQFEFLPRVHEAVKLGSLAGLPHYRVGLAALRQYDYHSSIPEAHKLMQACFALEQALEAANE